MADNRSPKVSFLIVNWNGGEIFKQCIQSIERNVEKSGIKDYETIVADNNSSDLETGWLLARKNIKLIQNTENLGFAAGTNQCVDMSTGDCLFFMNNDVVLNDDNVASLFAVLDIGRADAVVPKLLYPDGTLQYSIRGFPSLFNVLTASLGLHLLIRRLDTWFLKHFNYMKRQMVLQPMFSAVLMNRTAWDAVGKMDEKFPILFNDVDWFYRFDKLGMTCIYVPDAEAVHVHGMSVNRHAFKKIVLSVKSMIDYFKKHNEYSLSGFVCLYAVAALMMVSRCLKEPFSELIRRRHYAINRI